MTNSLLAWGSIAISSNAITARPGAVSGVYSGRRSVSHVDREIKIFPILLSWMTPGFMLILEEGDRRVLAGPNASGTTVIRHLMDCGYEPRRVSVPFVVKNFRPLLWWYLRRHDFGTTISNTSFRYEIDSDLEDWILEMAAGGECPLEDVLTVASKLVVGSLDLRAASAKAVLKLQDQELIDVFVDRDRNRSKVAGTELQEILDAEETWRVAEDRADGFYLIATSDGIKLDSKIAPPRASARLS